MNWASFGWGFFVGVLAAAVVCVVVGAILTWNARIAEEASE